MPPVASPLRHQLDEAMNIIQPHPPHNGEKGCQHCNAVAKLRFVREHFGDLVAQQEHAVYNLVSALWEFNLEDMFTLRVLLAIWRDEGVSVPRTFAQDHRASNLLAALREARDAIRGPV
jgi:hypothetical protein